MYPRSVVSRAFDSQRPVKLTETFRVQQSRVVLYHPAGGDGRVLVRTPRVSPSTGRDGGSAKLNDRSALIRVSSGRNVCERRGVVCSLESGVEVVLEKPVGVRVAREEDDVVNCLVMDVLEQTSTVGLVSVPSCCQHDTVRYCYTYRRS